MNNQGLLALAQLILPSEILTNFEVVHVEEVSSAVVLGRFFCVCVAVFFCNFAFLI